MNVVARVIELQKHLKKSNQDIANIIRMSDEGWRKIKDRYVKSNGEYDYPFSYEQIVALRRELEVSVPFGENIINHRYEAMPIDDASEFSALLREAKGRDYTLLYDVVRCIAHGAEEDFPILRQTVNLLIRQADLYSGREALMLMGMVRNTVTQNIRRLFGDDETLQKFCEGYEQIAKDKLKESFFAKYEKECIEKCRAKYKEDFERTENEEQGEALSAQVNKEALQRFEDSKEIALKQYISNNKELYREKVRYMKEKIIVERVWAEVEEGVKRSIEKGILAYLKDNM